MPARRGGRQALVAWLFLLPFLAPFVVLWALPIVHGLYLSFTNASLTGAEERFVGLANYQRLLADPTYRRALANTVVFVVENVPVLVVAGLLLALLLNQRMPGLALIRAAFVAPYLVTASAVAIIWQFVLDPATDEVTHIVIQKGWLLPEDKVVPFCMVTPTGGGRLILNEEVGDFDKLPPFEETNFVRATGDLPGDPGHRPDAAYLYMPAYYWYPSHAGTGFPGFGVGPYAVPAREMKRNIPEDTIPLKEGTQVVSSDGEHVGNVDHLFTEGDSNKVTHFLISQRILFKDRKLVPAHWVKSVEEDTVYLVVSSELLERLPSYQE